MRLFKNCYWSFAWIYINTILVYTLHWLCTLNVTRFNKRKWLYTKKAKSWWYPAETMADADYTDDLMLLGSTPAQGKPFLHSLEQAAWCIDLHMNANKTEFICFKREGTISTQRGWPLKLVNKFKYLGNNISFRESDVNIFFAKLWSSII